MPQIQSQAIRGATTIENNVYSEIEAATVELLEQILDANNLDKNTISHVMFSMTNDLNAGYPAKAARNKVGFDNVPMLCFQELDVPGGVEKCIRIMMVINTDKEKSEIKHVYLNNAKVLRPDL